MAISKGDVLQRLTATGLILGGLLTLASNLIFPRADDPSSIASWVVKAAENEVQTQLAALGIAVGVWAIVAGVAGIYRSIVAGAAAAWARIGFYGVIIGGAMFGVSSALVFGACVPETPQPPEYRFQYAAQRLDVRDLPEVAGTVLARLPRGTPVAVGTCGEGWCGVATGDVRGYA